MDSGAAETVMPRSLATLHRIHENEMSKFGVEYEVANGEAIPNLGERRLRGETQEGNPVGITAQVCAVNKCLLSVWRLNQSGHQVIFDGEESRIVHKADGRTTKLTAEKGIYTLKVKLKRPVEEDDTPGFTRPGSH